MTNPGDAVGTNGAYGGRTSVNAFNDVLSVFDGPGIVTGWGCVPKGGMTVALGGSNLVRDVAIAVDSIGNRTTIDNISQEPIELTLDKAPSVGSRIDLIVAYVKNPPDVPTPEAGETVDVDNPSVCGLIAVSSGISETPTIPTEMMIREAITADGAAGSQAYYVVLAQVTITAGLTDITSTNIQAGDRAYVNSTVDIARIFNYAGDNQLAFGLGGKAIDMGETDFNDYPARGGFYMGYGTHCPPVNLSSNNWWYVEQIVHLDNFMIQIARSFFDNNQIWQRIKNNGTWQPWTRISTSPIALNQNYPVGSIFICSSGSLDTPEKVAAALGGGTWVRINAGRAIVGYNSADGDFNVLGKEGGAKTVTLSANQIPSHTHIITNYRLGGPSLMGNGTTPSFPTIATNDANTGATGGGQAHNNLSPYTVRYIYQRTA